MTNEKVYKTNINSLIFFWQYRPLLLTKKEPRLKLCLVSHPLKKAWMVIQGNRCLPSLSPSSNWNTITKSIRGCAHYVIQTDAQNTLCFVKFVFSRNNLVTYVVRYRIDQLLLFSIKQFNGKKHEPVNTRQ